MKKKKLELEIDLLQDKEYATVRCPLCKEMFRIPLKQLIELLQKHKVEGVSPKYRRGRP